MKTVAIVGILLALAFVVYLLYPERAEGERRVYQSADGVNLTLTIYRPDNWETGDRRPCVVWFFGGGWEVGSPDQFYRNAERLAQLGLVSITPDYRVRSRHGSKITPLDSAKDATAAIRWIRKHADELGIDSKRIAAGGGSSGGHLAAFCAITSPEASAVETETSTHHPNALLLYNPVLDFEIPFVKKQATSAEMELLSTISPFLLLKEPLPPTLIMHGEDDRIVPVQNSVDFVAKAEALGSREIKLIRYEGKSHEFYLHGPGSKSAFRESMAEVIRFLTELEWIENPNRKIAQDN